MLQRVMIDGIELPRLYIAENAQDVRLAKSKGIPYIKWSRGQNELIKMLLRPTLERMFPHIKWDLVLGPRRRFRTTVEMVNGSSDLTPTSEVGRLDKHIEEKPKGWKPKDHEGPVEEDERCHAAEDEEVTEVADIARSERLFTGGGGELMETYKLSIEDYVGDMSSYVNIDVLQRLRLMPAFIGDILDCIRLNVSSGMYWSEGYNKKRALPVGRYDASGQLPNLVILDVSGSIPRGISATMIALVDTLRSQLTADLIITGSNSRFYPMGEKLPSPQKIRDMFGYGNESEDFFNILANNIRGRHYGHVFSFGDYDTPYYPRFYDDQTMSLEGTRVEHVHHYHTRILDETGYAKWCMKLAKKPIVEYDTSWCRVMER